jgi:transposase
MDIPALLKLEDPVLEGRFHPGNPSYKDDRYEQFKGHIDYFIKELGRVGVTKQLLWEEYKRDYPQGYSHSQFCYHLKQHQVASKPSMVLLHKAGEKLYMDFAGKKLSYINPATGEIIYCQVFVACLPYSDYSFVMAVRSQGVEDFLFALSCCLNELGGVPQLLVPDNLKSAITKASPYEPGVNRALEDME